MPDGEPGARRTLRMASTRLPTSRVLEGRVFSSSYTNQCTWGAYQLAWDRAYRPKMAFVIRPLFVSQRD